MGGVAASLGSFVVPPLLRNGNVVRAAAATKAAADPGRWKFSGPIGAPSGPGSWPATWWK